MKIAAIKNLSKSYPAFSLSNISFSLEMGAITGFIGRNGAGKTTTIKSILGFVHPDCGSIEFFGMNYKENEMKIKQKIGYVTGGFSFYPNKKLKDITKVTSSFYSQWDNSLYKNLCNDFNLNENKTPSQLSEGMKVKYSIALALSHHAELLILDEPTSGLDPVSRDELLDLFLKLQEEGVTIFFSTHITSDLEKCADNIVYIKKGKIHTVSSREEMVKKYKLLRLSSEEYNNFSNKQVLIGTKKYKDGYEAIVLTKDALSLGIQVQDVSLETIIIHLEKEE